jgi:hypothetical protein
MVESLPGRHGTQNWRAREILFGVLRDRSVEVDLPIKQLRPVGPRLIERSLYFLFGTLCRLVQ